MDKPRARPRRRVRALLAAAVRGRTPDALAAVVGAVTTAAARHTPTETELLSLFAAYEELEEEPAQEWIAGTLGPLGALVPDGAGDGLCVRFAAAGAPPPVARTNPREASRIKITPVKFYHKELTTYVWSYNHIELF